jgi:hypothetical protein
MQLHNFACTFVCHIEGGTWTEGAREQGAEENIWTQDGGSDRGWRKLRREQLHNVHFSLNIIRVMTSRAVR